MSLKPLPLLCAVVIALAAAGVSIAQAPPQAVAAAPKILGTTSDVEGLVTVSLGTTVDSVVDKAPVIEGSRYVTGSSGSVVLNFNNDCRVKLEANQTFTVDSTQHCYGAVASLTGAPLAAAPNYLPLVGLVQVAGIALLSTNVGGGVPPPGGGVPPGDGGNLPDLPISGQ